MSRIFKQANLEFNRNVVTDSLSGKILAIVRDLDGNRIQVFEK